MGELQVLIVCDQRDSVGFDTSVADLVDHPVKFVPPVKVINLMQRACRKFENLNERAHIH